MKDILMQVAPGNSPLINLRLQITILLLFGRVLLLFLLKETL